MLLVRDYKSLEEVTVKANQHRLAPRMLRFCSIDAALCGQLRCLTAGVTINTLQDEEKEEVQRLNFKVYPNPVQRSQKMNIEFTSEHEGNLTIRAISIDGKQVISNGYKATKGINRLEYPVDSKIAPGIYIIQIIDQKDKLIKSEKLIIQ